MSNAIMSVSQREPQAHFRFLDLPKEIRLMVYDRLRMRKRYHAFRPIVPSPELCHEQPFAFMTTALTGLALLATCHQVHEEASTILRMRIAHLDKQPLRVITSSKYLINHLFLGTLQSVAAGESPTRDDFTPDCLFPLIDRLLRYQGHLNVIIAIRDIDLSDPTTESFSTFLFRVQMFCMGCIGLCHYMRGATTPRLKLWIRTVLTVPDEDKVFETVQCPDPFVDALRSMEDIVWVDENIKGPEWEQDWAEGERYF